MNEIIDQHYCKKCGSNSYDKEWGLNHISGCEDGYPIIVEEQKTKIINDMKKVSDIIFKNTFNKEVSEDIKAFYGVKNDE
jgi:RNA polymerase subunit RPABC4/transcription elongation factor Spt4